MEYLVIGLVHTSPAVGDAGLGGEGAGGGPQRNPNESLDV